MAATPQRSLLDGFHAQQTALQIVLAAKPPASADKLRHLDAWMRTAHVADKHSLLRAVSWKLSRGVFRPALLSRVAANTDQDVADALKDAYSLGTAAYPQVQQALRSLASLRGVGVATASLVLSTRASSVPFMSDEALVHVLKVQRNKLRYSWKEYDLMYVEIHRMVRELDSTHPKPGGWTAVDCERAIWANAVIMAQESAKSGGPGANTEFASAEHASSKKRNTAAKESSSKNTDAKDSAVKESSSKNTDAADVVVKGKKGYSRDKNDAMKVQEESQPDKIQAKQESKQTRPLKQDNSNFIEGSSMSSHAKKGGLKLSGNAAQVNSAIKSKSISGTELLREDQVPIKKKRKS